jgi:hypothetical protein
MILDVPRMLLQLGTLMAGKVEPPSFIEERTCHVGRKQQELDGTRPERLTWNSKPKKKLALDSIRFVRFN